MEPNLVDFLNNGNVASVFSEESFVNAAFTVGLLAAISFAVAMGVIACGYWAIQWFSFHTRSDKPQMEQIATYRPSSFEGKQKHPRRFISKPHPL